VTETTIFDEYGVLRIISRILVGAVCLDREVESRNEMPERKEQGLNDMIVNTRKVIDAHVLPENCQRATVGDSCDTKVINGRD